MIVCSGPNAIAIKSLSGMSGHTGSPKLACASVISTTQQRDDAKQVDHFPLSIKTDALHLALTSSAVTRSARMRPRSTSVI